MTDAHGDERERRADRRARLVLELAAARIRRRSRTLTLRLPSSLPVPDRPAGREPPAATVELQHGDQPARARRPDG